MFECGSVPSIWILSLSICNGSVNISCHAKIAGASHTRLLAGDLVGHAVQWGDDRYAHITNWKTGQVFTLSAALSSFQAVESIHVAIMRVSCITSRSR